MTAAAFSKIAEGLDEVLAIARGEAQPARLHLPAEIDVRAIRKKTGLSQEAFASCFAFTVHQLRQWEQGRHRPLGAMRAYLLTIDRDPQTILRLLGVQQTGKAA